MRRTSWVAIGAVTCGFGADTVRRGAAGNEQEFSAGTHQPMPNVLGVTGDPHLVQWLSRVREGMAWSHYASQSLLKPS